MFSPAFRSFLVCGLFAAGAVALRPAESAVVESRPAPIIWTLTDPAVVGGETAEPLGARRPEAVADAGGRPALRCNGTDSGLLVAAWPLADAREFTVEMLIRPAAGGPREQRFLHFEDAAGARGLLELRMNAPDRWSFDAFVRHGAAQLVLHDPAKTHPTGGWTWVAMRYDGGRLTSFVNGAKDQEGEVTFGPLGATGKVSLGVRQTLKSWFAGDIAEVRWHRRALPATELQREGGPLPASTREP